MAIDGDEVGFLGGNGSDFHESSAYSSDGTNTSNFESDVSGLGEGDTIIQYYSNGDNEGEYEPDEIESESNATNQGDAKYDARTFAISCQFQDLSGISDFGDDHGSLCPPSRRTNIITTDGTQLFGFDLMNRIHTYSVEQDEWCERNLDIFGDVKTKRELGDVVLTYDKKNDDMWIQSPYAIKGLSKINLNTGKLTQFDVQLQRLVYPAMLMVGDILHIVCCEAQADRMTHITFNTITHGLTKNDYTSSNLDGYQGTFTCEKLIFSKSTNQLYLFGSGNVSDPRDCDGNVLFKYSLDTKIWTPTKATNLHSFGVEFYGASIVFSSDEQFVFALRGRSAVTDEGDIYSNKLVVYDMANNTMRCCSLKLPPRGNRFRCEAVILRYRWEESLLSIGYVRKLLQSPDLNGLTLPEDLMHFISQWIAIEFIHVVQTNSRCGQHFRVNVEDIMESLQ